MRLKNRKTGEIGVLNYFRSGMREFFHVTAPGDTGWGPKDYKSLTELNEDWEDAPEEKKYGGRVPEKGDRYWQIYCDGDIDVNEWQEGNLHDRHVFECGNAFWTREEAEKELKRRKAYVILKEDTKGFRPYKGAYVDCYGVGYNYKDEELFWRACPAWLEYGSIVFGTLGDANASIKAHPSEWKAFLGVEE